MFGYVLPLDSRVSQNCSYFHSCRMRTSITHFLFDSYPPQNSMYVQLASAKLSLISSVLLSKLTEAVILLLVFGVYCLRG
jgi:hypothetical protein